MSEDCGTEVPILVPVGEVVVRDAHGGEVLDGPDVLLVGRVLALAGHPHAPPDRRVPGLRHGLDMVHQSGGGVIRQVGVVLIGLRKPTEDL